MCYHTIQTKLALQIEKRFNAKIKDKSSFAPDDHVNGFTFPKTPIITNEDVTIIENFNWGLIPAWSKNDDIKVMTLNAKIETIKEKPSFKDVVNQRCLIIANGFYEWQWLDSKGKNKIKYQIGIGNEELFAFAGLYSRWNDTKSGQVINTYTMLTTHASPLMAKIHNIKKRMPIVLHPEDESKWLNLTPVEDFAYPYKTDLVAKQISNNPQHLSLF
ncbi:SOS response-associated peptidase [Flavobacterium sp. GP15]|uniref:SOS response-associated peptidase n=1 Tax=Flavobacterium sp. GP15 TaxID=2758567 RepID=UPI00165D771A|nr:SOS response-associated peptidase [Flavobacterium sp. GP15]